MARNTQIYYPPPESRGGWRWLKDPAQVRAVAGMDPDKLDLLRQEQESLYGEHSWSIVVVRHGYLVREFYTHNVLIPTRFDVWSGTKSFTGTAWGLLLEDSRQGRLPNGQRVDLDSPAYSFIPEGHPLSDPRKERITVRHLLTMTSGIPGQAAGVVGMPTATEHGPFEHALGRCPNRYGKWADRLSGEPGTCWDYSDPAFAHLALAFAHLAGREMSDYLQERVFAPIGIENLSWDVQGGSGFLGPHTNAHTGVHVSARELARFGYLMLHGGVWEGQPLVPRWWIELATQTSQDLNPSYGYTWWVNTRDTRWPGIPRDAFALEGFRTNRCYVVPSLDLVVARVASGPPRPGPDLPADWDEQRFLENILAAIVPHEEGAHGH
jgi:CubicO group peptidase (beta-lactamase class C family)